MFKLFSEEKSHDLKLVWRFDSAGVSAIAYFTHAPYDIVYYHTTPLFFSAADAVHVHKYHQLLNRTESILSAMTKRFLEHIQRQPDSIDVVFGEPWSHISVRHISYQRKTKFKLTHGLLKDLVNRDVKNIKQRGSISTLDSSFSEPVYHRISIGGHPVYEVTSQSVGDVRLDYTVGNLNTDINTVVMKALRERFHVSVKKTRVYHYQDLLINFFSQTERLSGCVIDVSGYLSDVYVFQNGILKQWGTVPFGEMSMIEIIAGRMGVTLGEFATLLNMYRKDLLSDDMREVIKNAFKKSISSWTEDLQKFLSSAATDGMIIDQVFWIGSETDPLLSLFVQTVQSDKIIFPHIFGTHTVGNMYGSALLAGFAGYEEIKLHVSEDQDAIIMLALP